MQQELKLIEEDPKRILITEKTERRKWLLTGNSGACKQGLLKK